MLTDKRHFSLPLIGSLRHQKESCNEEYHADSKLDVEEQPERIAASKHVSSRERTDRSKTERSGVVANTLPTFVQEVHLQYAVSTCLVSTDMRSCVLHHSRIELVALRTLHCPLHGYI